MNAYCFSPSLHIITLQKDFVLKCIAFLVFVIISFYNSFKDNFLNNFPDVWNNESVNHFLICVCPFSKTFQNHFFSPCNSSGGNGVNYLAFIALII